MSERSDQRIDAAIGVIIRLDGASEPCLTQSVGVRGLAVATRKVWPVGTIVEIVDQGMRVSATARVVGLHPGGCGLEFTDPSPKLTRDLRALLASLVGGVPSRTEPPPQLREIMWDVPEAKGGIAGFFRGRGHKARLIDLSLDGAAIAGKNPPEVGTKIIVTLPNHFADEEERTSCTAKVVRHTERGFAVQFVSPSSTFRRAISSIRKGLRG